MTVEDEAIINKGMVHGVGSSIVTFYADNGLIGSRNLEYIQVSLTVLIGLFRRIDLMTNLAKSKTTMYQLGTIQSGIPEKAIGQRGKGI